MLLLEEKEEGATMVQATKKVSIKSHRDLLVWQKAVDLVDRIYDATDRFPGKEEYRLVSQLVRAAISVPANIAEGSTRATSRDFAHFLVVAKASIAELDTEIEIARRRGYVSQDEAEKLFELMDEVSRMATGLRSKVLAREHRH
jgi:four helix bundle protein